MPTSSREDFVNGLMGQEVAHEVYAAALPGGIQDPGSGGLEAFMGIGDTSLTPRKPRLVRARRNSVQ